MPLLQQVDGTKEVKTGTPVRAIHYNMFGFFGQVVGVYCEVAGVKQESLRKVATPGLDDHQLKPEDFETEGHLSADAAKVIMKALYGARLVRYDLLWAHMLTRQIDCEVDNGVWQAPTQADQLHPPHP